MKLFLPDSDLQSSVLLLRCITLLLLPYVAYLVPQANLCQFRYCPICLNACGVSFFSDQTVSFTDLKDICSEQEEKMNVHL